MYLQNKYTSWYFRIIDRAKSRSLEKPYELHHILPRTLGGSNLSENLVKLTPREHFICHWLLTKMLPVSAEQKRLYHAFSAFAMISSNQHRKITSNQYQILSIASKIALKGNTHGKGKKRSKESKEKQRQTMLEKYKNMAYKNAGKTYDEIYGKEADERRLKLQGPRGPRKNPPGPQQQITCPHCKKVGGISNMKRYHFDNCSRQ